MSGATWFVLGWLACVAFILAVTRLSSGKWLPATRERPPP